MVVRDAETAMSFSRDRRGQSVVVGTVILFGFLILAISLYQVQIVPQENAQVEFEHFQEVRNDMIDLRAGILNPGTPGTNTTQYQTVQLGTTYPPRLFAINPPAPSGTIRTVDTLPIIIENASGETREIQTNFIQYYPGYNEIDQSSIWYDSSILYVDASDEGGGIAVIEDQAITTSNEVEITAVQRDFRRSGTGRVTVELFKNYGELDLPSNPTEVKIPTRLTENELNEKTSLPIDRFEEAPDPNYPKANYATLDTTGKELEVNTVGVQEAPEDPTQNDNGAVNRGQSLSFSSVNIRDESNPPNPGGQQSRVIYDVEYVVDDPDGEFDRVDIEFQNNDNPDVSETISSPTLSDTVTHDPRKQDADFGDEYQITVRLFGTNGEVVNERVVVSDTADDNNP